MVLTAVLLFSVLLVACSPEERCSADYLIGMINLINGSGDPERIPQPRFTLDLEPDCTYTLTEVATSGSYIGWSGLPPIEVDLTINGNGAIIERSTAEGTPEFRIFNVAERGRLVLRDVNVRNGKVTTGRDARRIFGGGISNMGTVWLHNADLSNNSAKRGGGVYNEGTLIISHDSHLTENRASPYGGGIYNDGGRVIISESVISSNESTGGIGNGGGGIYNQSGSIMVDQTMFTNNQASGYAGSGGGIKTIDGSLSVNDSTFSRNNAGDRGGGLHISGRVTIENSTFMRNAAAFGGGGIWNASHHPVDITNSTFSGNSAAFGGGINNSGVGNVMKISSSTFYRNSATKSGGGIQNPDFASLQIKNTIVAGSMSGGDCAIDSRDYVASGTNLDSDGTCTDFSMTADPLLERLANNGGTISFFTMTHALRRRSPAIDAVSDCTTVDGADVTHDQRHWVRGFSVATCDIGSYEYDAWYSPPPAVPVDGIVPEPGEEDSGSASEALVYVPCGDGVCNADYEDSLSCPIDCGEPESDDSPLIVPEVITPIPSDTPISLPNDPRARFTINAHCRRGPGTAYDIVTSLFEGEEVMLEGRSADNSWWWARLPESTAHCWVADSVVVVDGPMLELPVVAAPPLPTDTPTATRTPTPTPKPPKPKPPKPQLSPPAAPSQLTIANKVCTDTKYRLTLEWFDGANNEDGYRVFRDGQLLATLGKNSNSYKENPPGSGPYTYGVEAFNPVGASGRPSVFEEGCLY
jgi:hypothetical protein